MSISERLHTRKIFKGIFEYFEGDRMYAQETFEVYKDTSLYDMFFISEMLGRTKTGEMLKTQVYYEINKNWTPTKVVVEKFLGPKSAKESYVFNNQNSSITYEFKSKHLVNTHTMNTGPKFHITTPTAATSMLFIQTKKFDTTSSNECAVIACENQWRFRAEPVVKSVFLERISLTAEALSLNKSIVQATHYKIHNARNTDFNKKKKRADDIEPLPPVDVYLSPHASIPYLIQSPEMKIQIKTLNNLEQE